MLEAIVLAIVAGYVAVQLRREPRPARFVGRLLLTAAAGAVAETSCIRMYGFYAYDAGWRLWLDRVPLAVALVWPVVIHSASQLAGALLSPTARASSRLRSLVTGLLVLTDAAFIEPVAVHAGLWRWTEPGVFGVPTIGVLGWAFFAAACAAFFDLAEATTDRLARALRMASAAGLVVVSTHAALLATWWGLLRRLPPTAPEAWVAATAWALSAGLLTIVRRRRPGARIPPVVLLLRVPAAGFFVALLALHWPETVDLPLYAAAFVPPYVLMTAQSLGRRQNL